MKWRYQPVIVGETGDEVIRLIECHFNDDNELELWTEDDGIEPQGETVVDLGADLMRMYIDAMSWAPVRYKDLRIGMSFERTLTMQQRNALADLTEKIAHNWQAARPEE